MRLRLCNPVTKTSLIKYISAIKVAFIVLIYCAAVPVSGNDLTDEMSQLLEQLVNEYDANLRPNFGGRPVVVSVTMHVDSIGPISEVNMNFRLDISFRQRWKDARLRYDTKYDNTFTLSHEFLRRIWTPDTYFPDSLSSNKQDVMTPNVLVRLHPDGSILYSARVTILAKCPMKLHYFPMDMQVCKLLVECYGYTTKDLILQWGLEDLHAVEVPPHLQVAQFSLVNTSVDSYNLQFSTGNFSDLEVKFLFKRDLMYFILQSYVPSTLIVFLSWVSFWVNRQSVPARASLAITSILTLITLIGTTNSSLPKVSEVKALDVYFAMCSVYVFGAIVEFASTSYLTSKENRQAELKRTENAKKVSFSTETTIALPDFSRRDTLTSHPEAIQYQVETSFCSFKSDPYSKKCPNVEIINEKVTRQVIKPYPHELNPVLGAFGEPDNRESSEKSNQSQITASKVETYSRIGFPFSFFIMQILYWSFYWHMSHINNPLEKPH